ncbi:MAG: surface polysaccharide O-acyltransferase-like enzyme [Celeribacter sp.]
MRSLGLEIGRVGLALLVVSLHSSALSDVTWLGASVLNHGLARLAVPFFFLLSGYFIGPAFAHDFGRWLLRIVALYAAWSVICAPVWIAEGVNGIGFFKNILIGYRHLWYLTGLGIGGTILYFVRSASTTRLLSLATGLYLVACLGELYIRTKTPVFGLPDHLSVLPFRNGIFFGFPFMAIGYVMARHADILDKVSSVLLAMIITAVFGALLAEVLMSYMLFDMTGPYDCLFALFIATPALFIGLMRASQKRVGRGLGQLATGIYFVHIPILVVIGGLWPDIGPTTRFALTVLCTFAALPVLFLVNRRLPLL